MVLLIWVYYSTQIFLLGAEITKAYAMTHSSALASAPRPLQVGFGSTRQKPLPPATNLLPEEPVRTAAPPARVAGVARIVGTTAFGVVAGLMIGRIARQLSGRAE
jgi:membrane protein